jgi:hypothetical protein
MSETSHQTVHELLSYIFGDTTDFLTTQFADWALTSRRFRAFALTYRDKIRKKIRGTRDPEGLRDLLFELETAYFLLQERMFSVEYEKFGTGKQRTPDFSVTYRSNIVFNAEVKRLRAASQDHEAGALPPAELALPADMSPPAVRPGSTHILHQETAGAGAVEGRESGKLTNTVCNKVGQMPPGMINILVIAPDGDGVDELDVAQTMKSLKGRAERKDDLFFARRGCVGAREFIKQYQQLSGILLRRPGERPQLWVNAQAKHPIPVEIRTILQC